MIIQITSWIVALIAVEAIVEIITSSEIFFELRNGLSRRSNLAIRKYKRYRTIRNKYKSIFMSKLATLFSCGYCMSVWVSFFSIFLPGPIDGIQGYILRLFFLHRMSNLFHELSSRWFKRLPIVIVTTSTNSVEQPVEQPIEVPNAESTTSRISETQEN